MNKKLIMLVAASMAMVPSSAHATFDLVGEAATGSLSISGDTITITHPTGTWNHQTEHFIYACTTDFPAKFYLEASQYENSNYPGQNENCTQLWNDAGLAHNFDGSEYNLSELGIDREKSALYNAGTHGDRIVLENYFGFPEANTAYYTHSASVTASSDSSAPETGFSTSGQAISPFSVWVPADGPVPALGSSIIWDPSLYPSNFGPDNIGPGYDPDYYYEGTVVNIAADYGYQCFQGDGSLTVSANGCDIPTGTLGYMLVLEHNTSGTPLLGGDDTKFIFGDNFESVDGQYDPSEDGASGFSAPYIFDSFSFSELATSFQGTGVSGIFYFEHDGMAGVWTDSDADFSDASYVFDEGWAIHPGMTLPILSVHEDVNKEGTPGTFFELDFTGDALVATDPATAFEFGFLAFSNVAPVLETPGLDLEIVERPNQTERPNSQFSAPVPFQGPVIDGLESDESGRDIITGQRLTFVTSILVDGETVDFDLDGGQLVIPQQGLDGSISFVYNGITIETEFYLNQSALEASTGNAGPAGFWTTKISETEVNIYGKNVIGEGKVQFFQNGQEVAWVRAADVLDPKLSVLSEGPLAGTNYLVRSQDLEPGKNVFEIYVDGERVWRAAYSLR